MVEFNVPALYGTRTDVEYPEILERETVKPPAGTETVILPVPVKNIPDRL